MSKKNNGGPAFPGPDQGETTVNIHEGMSLLDYYAGEAMKGFLSRGDSTSGISFSALVINSWEVAEMMIEKREEYL